MDVIYLSLGVVLWLLMVGMAFGCSRLGGSAK